MAQRFITVQLDAKNMGDIRDGNVLVLKSETDNYKTKNKTIFVVEWIRHNVCQARKTFATEVAARNYYNS